jgi:DHA1 family bicyclomycin/chloramphenicol resistance-like MFS transporter
MRLKPDTFALTAMLGLLTALGPLSTDMYLPSLPDLAKALGATTAQAQLTLSAFLAGFALGQIVYGPLSDRYGRRPVLMTGLAVYTAASAICALSTSIEMLTVARFVQALGACGPIVLARSIVRDLYAGPRAGQELSRMGTIMGLVPAAAPILGSFLHAAFGWRSNFAGTLLFGAAMMAWVWIALPETLKTRAPEVPSPAAIARVYAMLARNRAFLSYLGLFALSYGGLFAYISGSSFVLQQVYGLSPFAFGISFAVGVTGYIAGTMIATRIVPSLGIDRTVGIGASLLAAGGLMTLAAIPTGLGTVGIVGANVIYFAGIGLVMPQSMAGALTPFPERAGAASSLVGFCQMSFAALVGIVVGHALGSSAWPLAIAVALSGLATLALWAATRRVRTA